MTDQTDIDAEVEALIAYAHAVMRDDDELFDRRAALVRRNPAVATEIGETLLRDRDADRREMGIHLIGVAAQVDPSLRDRALPNLRRIASEDAETGPQSGAIIELAHLFDDTARHLVLAQADHPDPVVRGAVAFALASPDLDEPAINALCRLTTDEDADVRDWATFGLGQFTDADTPAIGDALFARLEDDDEGTRLEAISGLCRRQDERARPYLERALLDPDHPSMIDEALDFLEHGTGRYLHSNPPTGLAMPSKTGE